MFVLGVQRVGFSNFPPPYLTVLGGGTRCLQWGHRDVTLTHVVSWRLWRSSGRNTCMKIAFAPSRLDFFLSMLKHFTLSNFNGVCALDHVTLRQHGANGLASRSLLIRLVHEIALRLQKVTSRSCKVSSAVCQ